MKYSFSSIVSAAVLGLGALLPHANAQLSLSGSTRGAFDDPGLFFTWVNNGPVTSSLTTGLPFPFLSSTSLTFTGSTFNNVGENDLLSLGTVKIKNGVTLFDTAASYASLDLFLNLPDYGIFDHKLTTLLFGIENTPNLLFTPDVYYVGFSAPSTLKVGDYLVDFDINLTDPSYGIEPGHLIKEMKTGTVGLYAELNFTPVPEPSTYAAFAALGLGAVVIFRRRKNKSAAA